MSVTHVNSSTMEPAEAASAIRMQPPAPLRIPKRAFPEFTEHRLSNGVRVYLIESHVQPYLSVNVTFRSGASSDGSLPGLASFVTTLLISGAGGRSAQELADEIDFLGATLDAGAGRDDMAAKLGVLTRHLPAALDLLADVVLRPAFKGTEIARERRHAIADLKQAQSDPAWLAGVRFRREIYGETPYGTDVEGTEESLRRIRRADCVDFHARHFTADNAFIVAAGDARIDDLLAELESRFGAWHGAAPPPPVMPEIVPPTGPKIVVVDRPEAVQSSIRIGTLVRPRYDPDHIPLVMLHTLFGGYFNSRINHNLRERNGFTYGAGSIVESGAFPGVYSIRASVGNEVTGAAIGEILKELAIISSEPVPDAELTMARAYTLGSQSLQLETPGQVASFVRTIALYNLPHDYYSRFPSIINTLTSERLLEVAARYLRPDRMAVVVVGAADQIVPQLEPLGQVVVES